MGAIQSEMDIPVPKDLPESSSQLCNWPPALAIEMMNNLPRMSKSFGYNVNLRTFQKVTNIDEKSALEIWETWGGGAKGKGEVNMGPLFCAIMVAGKCTLNEKIKSIINFFDYNDTKIFTLPDFRILGKNFLLGYFRLVGHGSIDETDATRISSFLFLSMPAELRRANRMKSPYLASWLAKESLSFDIFTSYYTTDAAKLKRRRGLREILNVRPEGDAKKAPSKISALMAKICSPAAKLNSKKDSKVTTEQKAKGSSGKPKSNVSGEKGKGTEAAPDIWNKLKETTTVVTNHLLVSKSHKLFPKSRNFNLWPKHMQNLVHHLYRLHCYQLKALLHRNEYVFPESAKEHHGRQIELDKEMKSARAFNLVAAPGVKLHDLMIKPGTRFEKLINIFYPDLNVKELRRIDEMVRSYYDLRITCQKIIRMQKLFYDMDKNFTTRIMFQPYMAMLQKHKIIDEIYIDFFLDRTDHSYDMVYFKEVVEMLFGFVHQNKMKEYNAVVRKVRPLSEKELMRVKGMFHMYDKDGSGTIERSEMHGVYKDLKEHSKEAINEMFDKIDTDGSGDIDLEEFVEFFRLLMKRKNSKKGVEEREARRKIFETMEQKQLEDVAAKAGLIDKSTKLALLTKEALVYQLVECVSIPIPVVKKTRKRLDKMEAEFEDPNSLTFEPIEMLELGQMI